MEQVVTKLIQDNRGELLASLKGEKILIFVPSKITRLMNYIGNTPRLGSMEYGMYLKTSRKVIEGILCYIVSEEYYIPEQDVTAAAISFTESRPDYSFNAVIHRHPEGVNEFSGTDETSVNANFDLSLLYQKSKGIFRGHLNLNLEGIENRVGFKTNNVITLEV